MRGFSSCFAFKLRYANVLLPALQQLFQGDRWVKRYKLEIHFVFWKQWFFKYTTRFNSFAHLAVEKITSRNSRNTAVFYCCQLTFSFREKRLSPVGVFKTIYFNDFIVFLPRGLRSLKASVAARSWTHSRVEYCSLSVGNSQEMDELNPDVDLRYLPSPSNRSDSYLLEKSIESSRDDTEDTCSSIPPASSVVVASVKDRGYAWVICAAAFVDLFVVLGMHYSFGVLYSALLDHFEEPIATTGKLSKGYHPFNTTTIILSLFV